MGLTKDVYATQMAYDLVTEGMPFQDAYRKISREYVQ